MGRWQAGGQQAAPNPGLPRGDRREHPQAAQCVGAVPEGLPPGQGLGKKEVGSRLGWRGVGWWTKKWSQPVQSGSHVSACVYPVTLKWQPPHASDALSEAPSAHASLLGAEQEDHMEGIIRQLTFH